MMNLLFNKDNNGAVELRQLTAQYYKNNDFSRIETNIILATEQLIDLVGQAVYDIASTDYKSNTDNPLVAMLQLPIAIKATYHYYKENMVGHEDTGRKVKIDNENEKMAWEWMLNADDEAQLRKLNLATERLIRYLDQSEIEAWLSSDQKKMSSSLFLPNTQAFNRFYNIDSSARFYHTIVPIIDEVQQLVLAPAIGADYDRFLSEFKENKLDLPTQMHIQRAVALQTIALAAKRLGISLMPDGLVQNYKSDRGTLKSSAPATLEMWQRYCDMLKKNADDLLDVLKVFLRKNIAGSTTYPILPNQEATPKVFRT